jgi:hypothetical protein
MYDLVENKVDPVVSFETKFYVHKETSLWYYGIDSVLACERVIHGIHMQEPVHIRPLRPFPEY